MDKRKKRAVHVKVRGFLAPKAGFSCEQCEDALRISQTKFCVSDGAGSASYSSEWAWALCFRVLKKSPPSQGSNQEFSEWLAPARTCWNTLVPWERLIRPIQRKKAQRGSGATLAGIEILDVQETSSLRFRYFALGDSCIFLVRNNTCIWTQPIKHEDGFGFTPALIHTRQEYDRQTIQSWKEGEEEALPGDFLILATDALSEFIYRVLCQQNNDQELLPWIRKLLLIRKKHSNREFVTFIETKRRERKLRNDDVALVIIHISQG